jgi:PilZ domain-containing protein
LLAAWFEKRHNEIPFLIRAILCCRARKTLPYFGGSLLLKQQDLLAGTTEPPSEANKPADSTDRRKNVRFAVSASADMVELLTRTRLSGRASDLGVGGCYIDTVTPFPVGTSLVVNLTSEKHNVRAMAKVVYAPIGMGMGLAFAEMTPTQRGNLTSWLGELSGDIPKEQTASETDSPLVQEATIVETTSNAKRTGVLEALQELVSLLGTKKVLTEAEVELLRGKMSE